MVGHGNPRRFHQPDHHHLDRRLSVHGRAALMASGDMSTPLKHVRGLGPAKSGTGHFWRQRLTAVANVPLTIAFVLIVVALLGRNHAAVVQILGSPLIAVIMLLFIVSVTTHMRIGKQVIIEDYVHDEARKFILLIANTFFPVAAGLACVRWSAAVRRGSRLPASRRCSRPARTRCRRRAALPPRSATWARTTGAGTCTTPSKAPTGWATRMPSNICAAALRRRCTSWSIGAYRSRGARTARSISVPLAA